MGSHRTISATFSIKIGYSMLPKTGQTTIYQTGDDGTYQMGAPRAGPRFTDLGDGTIRDEVTGLMWAKDGTGLGCKNGEEITWTEAITWANGLDFAGYTDWRLPNILELISIVNYGEGYPSVYNPYFPNTLLDRYWTATTSPVISSFALGIIFQGGGMSLDRKTYVNRVRAVRGEGV